MDDRGTLIGEFKSVHDGMGRFDLQPAAGRRYRALLDKPVAQTVEIPAARASGCVLRAVDSERMTIAAFCSEWCTWSEQ